MDHTHWIRFLRKGGYPDDAPRGSKKREILEAMRRERDTRGPRGVEKATGLPRNTANYYARGDWKYLAIETVERWRRIIPEALDPADPRLQELLHTNEVLAQTGQRVGAAALAAWRKNHPRQHKRANQALREQHIGKPNPWTAAARRAEWDTGNPDRSKKEEAFLANVRRRRFPPSQQIRRAWERTVARCLRRGRTQTEADIQDCVRRQATDLDLPRKVVRLFVDQARGAPIRPGRLPDIDFYVMVRDIRRNRPQAKWIEVETEVSAWLGRKADADIKRQFSETKRRLGLTRKTLV